VVLSGLGSSYTAALAARPAFDALVDIPTYVLPATEMSLNTSLLGPDALVVVLSRSGERKFVIDACRTAQQTGALTIAVTGAGDSLMARSAARVILTSEGPESSFPKTKSVTAGIGVFLALALALAEDHQGAEGLRDALRLMGGLIGHTLQTTSSSVEGAVEAFLGCDRVIVAGTGGNTGAAMEIQIKLQESALVTTEGMDTGNLLHGPSCILDRNWLVALLVTADDAELSSETFQLVKAMEGRTLGIVPRDVVLDVQPDYSIQLPEPPHRLLEALCYLPVLQLLVYHWTIRKGLDPDSPPGKSVILNAIVPEGRKETDDDA
jgi:glucosamine--fructose-6-phosphate aminotransferase (isomerizing)